MIGVGMTGLEVTGVGMRMVGVTGVRGVEAEEWVEEVSGVEEVVGVEESEVKELEEEEILESVEVEPVSTTARLRLLRRIGLFHQQLFWVRNSQWRNDQVFCNECNGPQLRVLGSR